MNDLSAQVITVPHRKSFILDRAVLRRHIEVDDLDIGPDRLLPEKVILLARPSPDRRNTLERESTLLKYWRRLFHASVHLHLERLFVEGRLGEDEVKARIEGIGPIEFEEARNVLDKEGYLFPRRTDRDVYVEFAAVYLEFKYFLPDLLPVYFPGLLDHARVEAILARDIDAADLYQKTRLAGAAGPAAHPEVTADEPSEKCVQLVRDGRNASRAGNNVRAAILRTRAARIAPAALTVELDQLASVDLDQLADRLREALKLTEAERNEWRKDLPALLDKTGEGQWSAEARLLYDLQKACVDSEREVYALDLVEWLLSIGKRPIKRPLSGQRVVRITRHLRSAVGRLLSTRLSEVDRQHLGHLMEEALRLHEKRLRDRFRPVLTAGLLDVGLKPANAPEQAAFDKLVEELLDRIIEYGFFTFSDLRDAISRNNLKLPDLADPVELVRGDPLLRLDRLLASSPLDGVYRPGEFYLRTLQRVTAPNFGWRVGRLLTRYVTIPFGAALVILEGVELLIGFVCGLFGWIHYPLFGPISVLAGLLFPAPTAADVVEPTQMVVALHNAGGVPGGPPLAGALQQITWLEAVESGAYSETAHAADASSVLAGPATHKGAPPLPLLAPSLWIVLGFLVLGLLYSARVRQAFHNAGMWLWGTVRPYFVDWPLRIVPWPAVQRVPQKLELSLRLACGLQAARDRAAVVVGLAQVLRFLVAAHLRLPGRPRDTQFSAGARVGGCRLARHHEVGELAHGRLAGGTVSPHHPDVQGHHRRVGVHPLHRR